MESTQEPSRDGRLSDPSFPQQVTLVSIRPLENQLCSVLLLRAPPKLPLPRALNESH